MNEIIRLRRAVASTLSLAVMAALPGHAATPTASAQVVSAAADVGLVPAATPMSALVRLKGRQAAAFDAAVAALYDPSSPTYHQWMSENDLAAYAPTAQDVATATASLQAQGLQVDKAYDDGFTLKVSGPASRLQAAFGTRIHQLQANGRTLYKTSTAPAYQGANADLVASVSGLSSVGMQSFVARRVDLATGLPVPGLVPQAGTDPLASFTSSCFGPDVTATMSGFSASVGGLSGAAVETFKGPSYLNTTTTTNRAACGLTVKQIVQHYGIDEAHALGLTGKGQTIVIVDAYGSPTALADLNTFSKTMGLPSMNDRSFQVVYPDGQPAAGNPDWALETTLDVEWAHALAPDANIVLVVAPSEDNAELAYGIEYAASHHLGNVVSNSWGLAEADGDLATAQMFNHTIARAAARGVAVNVATGDSGDNGVGTPVGAPAMPSDSPWATGIGGTSIGVPSDNGPVEAAWGITLTQLGETIHPLSVPQFRGFLQGSGGGESVFMKKPSFQRHLPGAGRQLPDISALGDPQTGAIVVQTDPSTGTPAWFVVGGTSLATPIFSAIWALADQAAGESLGQAAPVIAALPSFAVRDILPIQAKRHNTSGSILFRATTTTTYDPAQLLAIDQTQPTGFVGTLVFVGMTPFTGWNDIGFGTDSSLTAAKGWDNATGYGVPNGLLFIEAARVFGRGFL